MQSSAIFTAAVLAFPPGLCSAEDAEVGYDDQYNDGDDDGNTVLGVLQTTDTLTSYGVLILFALSLCIVGWSAILYPFVFCPRFDETIQNFTSQGVKLQGRILSMRRGRVFNPLRWMLPTRYNCYVTVEYNGTRKELAVDEAAMDKLAERTDGNVDVYALPGYPQSGLLDGTLQSHEVTKRAKIFHVLAAILLLGLGVWTSLVSPADEIYSSTNLWKMWLVLAGHVAAFGLAYWACNFVHLTRVEALLYGTVDADGLQEYAENHQLANRGCSRGPMEMSGAAAAASAELGGVTALADSKDEVSERSSNIKDDEANNNYQAMT